MAYSVQADLLDQLEATILISLTDDAEEGSADAAVIAKAIDDADGEINGHLVTKYAVPLEAPIPPIIRKFSVDIAIYNLYSRRTFKEVPPIRQSRYDNAIKFLKEVAAGRAGLGADDPAGATAGRNAAEMSVESPDRVFTRDKLRGM